MIWIINKFARYNRTILKTREMKNFTLILFIFLSINSFAQYDPKAKEILDQMSEKYQTIPSFKADISYTLTNETEDIFEEFKGDITVMGDKYKLNIGGQEIINDGKTMWTLLEDVNEVNISEYDPDSEEISPSKIYNIYKNGYKYTYLNDKLIDGHKIHIVDLVPENKNNQFFKVRLEIDANSHELHSWKMYEKTGNVYSYDVTNFASDLKIKDSYFAFDESQHEGVEVIDFR